MATKPYPPMEETPSMAKEPVVAYQRTDPATYRDMPPCESDNGLHPFTWEEARKWIAEAEENIAAGRTCSHEEVLREIDELIWSYED